MSSSESRSVVVLRLAEEFLERYRQGERPPLREYLASYPELTGEIREVFPAMAMLEQIALADEAPANETAGETAAALALAREQLGDYRIVGEIGRGGMGVVYKAIQVSLGRQVALKLLPPQVLDGDRSRHRFEREARAAARLHHTNIVPVFGVGEHDGTPYYVMQFIPGVGLDAVVTELKRRQAGRGRSARAAEAAALTSLRRDTGACTTDPPPRSKAETTPAVTPEGEGGRLADRCSTASLSLLGCGRGPGEGATYANRTSFWQRVAGIGVQVADALEYAHSQGILHRDVKPSNLLLDHRGTVWVTDFGLAKSSGQEDLTHTGDLLGTLRYMPPEAFEGKFDARGDVYALGLTLYELLAQRPAFAATDRGRLLRQVTEGQAERLGRIAPAIPRDLETIVHKAMAREPGRRYPTAAALADDLRRFIAGRPIRARPVSTAERAWRWCRRNPWLAGAAGAAVAALAAVVVIALAYAAEQAAAKQKVGGLVAELETALGVSGRRLAALNHERARTHFERGRAACERGDIGPGLLDLVESWRSAVEAGDPDLAHAARASLSAWQHQAPRLVRQFSHANAGSVRCVALSPDGTMVATGSTDQTARLWDAATGALIGAPLAHRGTVRAVAFSPDGKTVLTAAGETARLWDVASGRPIGAGLEHPGTVRELRFSPDGKTVLTVSNDFSARLWDAANGRAIGAPLTHRGRVNDAAFSPDGKAVLTGSEDGTARRWDAGGRPIGGPLTHRANCVAYSPDGKTVLTGGYDRTAQLWDAATGQPLGVPLTHQGAVHAVAFSPDGTTILTGSQENTARLWDAATGNPIGPPLCHQGPVFTVAFSRDGKTALTGSQDGTARLWDAATGQPLAAPVHNHGVPGSVAFSGEGTTVLAALGDGTAQLWDVTPARPCGLPLTHQGRVNDVAFSRDGKAVLTGSEDGTARLWDAATGRPIGPPLRHRESVLVVAFSPEGTAVLTGSRDGMVRLWDVATGRPLGMFCGHRQAVRQVAFSPDGATLLTGGDDTLARLWNATTRRPIGVPLRHRAAVTMVAFSPDGQIALTASGDGTARRWDAATGRSIGHPLTLGGASVAFSPDGKTVAAGGNDDTAARFWDWDGGTGAPTGLSLPLPGGVAWLSFSRDGTRLLTAGGDGTLRLWDAATGRPTGAPVLHRAKVFTADLSPDGRRILSGFGEKLARVWDIAATGQPLGPPLAHRASVSKVAFSSDGRTALTVTDGNEALLWDVAELPDDLARVEDWVHVITGLALDELGELKQLQGGDWRQRHDRLCARGGLPEAEARWQLDPVLFGPAPTARARAWAERKQWAAAEAAYTEAVAARPLDTAVRLERARFYAASSQPAKADADFARAYALGDRDETLVDTLVARECLFRHVVAEAADSAAPLWAKHGALRLAQSRWDEAAADFARELELLPRDRRWQSARSRRAVELARWDRAYARLLELQPGDGQLWCARGRYHALRTRWDQAGADFARGIEGAAPGSEECFEHACLRLIVGDDDGYRAFVADLERGACRLDDPFVAYVLARTAVMATAPVVDPERITRWAERAVASSLNGWNLHTLGVAHYRAGRLDEAIKRLEESNAGDWGEQGRMQNRLVLAMAHHRLGRAAQARALLEEVTRWWGGIEAARTDAAVAMPPTDWLPLQLFRREAEALILGDEEGRFARHGTGRESLPGRAEGRGQWQSRDEGWSQNSSEAIIRVSAMGTLLQRWAGCERTAPSGPGRVTT
jgi:WD40 repeat protein/serine/threonine protein kinase/tetratricopeptide (TPR) repeat protein